MKRELTDRQLEVLVFMRDFFRENDQLPPQKVIGEKFGKTSVAGEHFQRALSDKGYIELNAVGKYRFVREAA
jgi:sulfur relay (sulfurtransferase) DsrC/TusE family protein